MKQAYVIGHDIGTGGCKGVLATTSGELVAAGFEPYPIHHPHPNWAEQDPGDWWDAVACVTRRLMEESGIDPGGVRAVGFAGQMLGIVPMDETGNPLRPAIIWLDSRADEQAERFIRRFGGRRMVIRVVGAAPSAKDVVCKLAWLKENEPGVFQNTRSFLDTTGFLVYRATGEMAIDHTGAGGTGIINNRRREWSPLFARILGLPLDKMPPIMSSIDIAGGLSAAASERMGLSKGTPVIAGMADIPAAATGSGALEDGDAHINIGTSSWLCVSLSRPRNLGRNGIAAVVSPDPGMYLLIGESETAGACLEWFARNFARRDEIDKAGEAREVFKILDEAADKVEPGAGRLLFAPWMFGERSPVADTDIRAAFINLSLEHRRDHLLRAIYEGVAYNLRWLLEVAARAGLPCEPLRAIGGGATSDVWMQIVSDVTRRRVEAVENPQEAGAMGCALAAAAATGAHGSFKDIKKVVRVRHSFIPREDCCRIYDQLYDVFRCIYPRLSGLCADLNSGGGSCAL
jgi:xylulokinase